MEYLDNIKSFKDKINELELIKEQYQKDFIKTDDDINNIAEQIRIEYNKIRKNELLVQNILQDVSGLDFLIKYMIKDNLKIYTIYSQTYLTGINSQYVKWFINKYSYLFKEVVYFHDIKLDKRQLKEDDRMRGCGPPWDSYMGENYRIQNRKDVRQKLIIFDIKSKLNIISNILITDLPNDIIDICNDYLYQDKKNIALIDNIYQEFAPFIVQNHINRFTIVIKRFISNLTSNIEGRMTEQIGYSMKLKIRD